MDIIIKGLIAGAKRYREVALTVYVLQWIFAGLLFMAVWSFFKDSMPHTPEINVLLKEWNTETFAVLKEFVIAERANILYCSIVLISLYLLISPHISAGVLYCVAVKQSGYSQFWTGVRRYGRPFLFLSAVLFVVATLWTLLPGSTLLRPVLRYLECGTYDSWLPWAVVSIGSIYCFGLLLLLTWTILIKQDYVRENQGLWNSILKSGRTLFNNLGPIIKMGSFVLVLAILLYVINLWLKSLIGISSVYLIVVFFLIQQGVVWSKIMLRIAIYTYLDDLSEPRLT